MSTKILEVRQFKILILSMPPLIAYLQKDVEGSEKCKCNKIAGLGHITDKKSVMEQTHVKQITKLKKKLEIRKQ